MLETKFKIVFLIVILIFAGFPIVGILNPSHRPHDQEDMTPSPESAVKPTAESTVEEAPLPEEMVTIPSGPFVQGTMSGGFDEQPERTITLPTYAIDRYEVTQYHYQQFVAETGHRKASPPSRYAKNVAQMKGPNRPVVYVSWDDAGAYCQWKGKRLPSEAEWEKAMRGPDGRQWPWGNEGRPKAANWDHPQDGFPATAPVGFFQWDTSPYGVADGAGNVMEWVADWYGEDAYKEQSDPRFVGPESGVYRVLRGGAYTTTGIDLRITSRSKMVPDFRDETIGFRCAVFMVGGEPKAGSTERLIPKENQNSKG